MLRCGVSSVVSTCIFALCKLLLFYNYVCRVDLLAFTVGVASGLNAAGDGDLRSLTQVFLCKFCLAAESNASDKVCGCGIAVSAESAVNSQISFLLLYFTARDEYYYLRYETMKTFWDRGQNGGKKHFSYTELETSFFLPRTGSSVLVPYLNGIQKDLEIRDSKAD